MVIFLLIVLALLCTSLICWGMLRADRMYQFPFLAGAVFGGWVFPQLVGLSNSDEIPTGALQKTLLMTILCAACCYLGHIANKRPLRSFAWQFDGRKLLRAATVLSLCGAYFYYEMSLLAETATAENGGGWTGIITIFVFFSSMVTVGLVLALVVHLNKPSRWSYMIIIFDLCLYFDRIVMNGRRAAMVELFVIAGLTLWFYRRKVVPRWLMLIMLVFGSLVINSIGDHRSAVVGQDAQGFDAVAKIDFIGNLESLFNHGGPELTNAAYIIEAVDKNMTFDLGLSHWNGFVNAYVPGQLVGADLKRSIMLDLQSAAYSEFSYTPSFGSTVTGLSDAFASYWYFGALEFFFIGFVMAKLFRSGNIGNVVGQALLMLVFVDALQSITHTTDLFFVAWPKAFVFLMPALLYAKIKKIKRVDVPINGAQQCG